MKKTVEGIEGILICEMLIPRSTTRGAQKLVVEMVKNGNFGYPIHYKLLMGYDTFLASRDNWHAALVYSDLTNEERKHLYECVMTSECKLP